MEWLADPRDCSTFYVCNRGQRFDFSCGENVWDQATKTCVGKGSQWDKCTIAKELDSLTAENELSGLSGGHPCDNSNTAVLAKSDNCAQYYDCSSREGIVSDDPYLQECEFPLLFNPNTKRCEHYDMVKCGDRMEPLDACDYVANQCQGRAHCVPCSVRFPSCRDLPDGLNPWVGREYSPYYVLCEKQRPLYHGQCDNSHGTQIFDPEKRVCDEFKGNN
nr:hypothetical protein BaRGS_005975 [Batillaria attramentaria]